jgi:hypothetical protein
MAPAITREGRHIGALGSRRFQMSRPACFSWVSTKVRPVGDPGTSDHAIGGSITGV